LPFSTAATLYARERAGEAGGAVSSTGLMRKTVDTTP
jgi:hypothetical protein